MMKSIKITVVLSVLALASISILNLSSSSAKNDEPIPATNYRTVTAQSDNVIYDNLEDLENAADIILVARIPESFEEREHVSTYYEDGTVQDFYTKTRLKIEKVFKGKEKLKSFKPRREFYVIEDTGMVTDSLGKVKIEVEGYHEMERGKRYTIFLKSNTFGEYSVINMNNGKVNYDKESETHKDIDGLSRSSLEMREQVRMKYKL